MSEPVHFLIERADVAWSDEQGRRYEDGLLRLRLGSLERAERMRDAGRCCVLTANGTRFVALGEEVRDELRLTESAAEALYRSLLDAFRGMYPELFRGTGIGYADPSAKRMGRAPQAEAPRPEGPWAVFPWSFEPAEDIEPLDVLLNRLEREGWDVRQIAPEGNGLGCGRVLARRRTHA